MLSGVRGDVDASLQRRIMDPCCVVKRREHLSFSRIHSALEQLDFTNAPELAARSGRM
jgi:hypothetical protein